MIGRVVTVTVDRPLGSRHPRHPALVYPINYGYVDGVMAPDGEYQDAYVLGITKPVQAFTGEVIAIVYRAEDTETKWVVAPLGTTYTADELKRILDFQEKYFTIYIEL